MRTSWLLLSTTTDRYRAKKLQLTMSILRLWTLLLRWNKPVDCSLSVKLSLLKLDLLEQLFTQERVDADWTVVRGLAADLSCDGGGYVGSLDHISDEQQEPQWNPFLLSFMREGISSRHIGGIFFSTSVGLAPTKT